jgi:hypothetical protein
LRAGPLSNDRVIDLLNHYYVSVYVSSDDYNRDGTASAAEKAERLKIMTRPTLGNPLGLYIVSGAGKVIDALHLNDTDATVIATMTDQVVKFLEDNVQKLQIKPGKTLVPPSPQSLTPPRCQADALPLHLTTRFLPPGELWGKLPAEDWIVLEKSEWATLLPPEKATVGTKWNLDSKVAEKILRNFYPPGANNEPARNQIEKPHLNAEVVSVNNGRVRVRLESNLTMKHFSLPFKEDNRMVKSQVIGFVDVDSGTRRVQRLRLVTEKGTYAGEDFGVALRTLE